MPNPSSSYQDIVEGEMLPPTVGEVPETSLDIQGDLAYETEPPTESKIPWPTLMGVPAYPDED